VPKSINLIYNRTIVNMFVIAVVQRPIGRLDDRHLHIVGDFI